MLFQANTGLGPYQVDEVTNAPVALQLCLLGFGELVFLVLDGQLVQAVPVLRVEFQLENGLRYCGSEVGPVGFHQPAEDGSLDGFGAYAWRCRHWISLRFVPLEYTTGTLGSASGGRCPRRRRTAGNHAER